ncbi:MAG: ribonuclease P protein component [Crocinitomicaceae bacterium]|nr:ribonuclease P protein component [Crocinitomicaceae bacterium]
MPKTSSFSYPKSERLRSKKLIDATFERGQKFKSWPLVAKWLDTELAEDVPCQTLVSVSKRSFRLAVDRNRIKRLMREAWRSQKHAAYAALQEHEKQRALVLIYVGKELPTLEGMHTSMRTLIAKMIEALAAPVRPQSDALKDE